MTNKPKFNIGDEVYYLSFEDEEIYKGEIQRITTDDYGSDVFVRYNIDQALLFVLIACIFLLFWVLSHGRSS